MPNRSPTIHHENGFSTLHRREVCPGSKKAERYYSSKESKDAERGTTMHEATYEVEIKNGLPVGEQILIEWAYSVIEEYLSQYDTPPSHIIENFLHLWGTKGNGPEHIISGGTPDRILLWPNHAVVFDWKYGYNIVKSARENLQIASQALAVHQNYGVNKVTGVICQPPIKSTTSHVFTEFETIAMHIQAITDKTEDESLVFSPMKSACKHCKARLGCPAYLDAFEKAGDDLPTDVQTLNNDDLCYYRDKAGAHNDIYKICSEELKRRLEADMSTSRPTINGWRLQSSATPIYYDQDILNEACSDINYPSNNLQGIATEDYQKFDFTKWRDSTIKRLKDQKQITAKEAKSEVLERIKPGVTYRISKSIVRAT